MLQPSRQACRTYSFETTTGQGGGAGAEAESQLLRPPLCPGERLWRVWEATPSSCWELSFPLCPVHCLGEINGVFRRVVGTFKPSLTRCQHKQTRKQMVMTSEHSCRRERAPRHKRAFVLESLDRRRRGHLIDNGGRRGQCFPNARLRKPCRRKQAALSRLLPASRVLNKESGEGRERVPSPAPCRGLERHCLFLPLTSLKEQAALPVSWVRERKLRGGQSLTIFPQPVGGEQNIKPGPDALLSSIPSGPMR